VSFYDLDLYDLFKPPDPGKFFPRSG